MGCLGLACLQATEETERIELIPVARTAPPVRPPARLARAAVRTPGGRRHARG